MKKSTIVLAASILLCAGCDIQNPFQKNSQQPHKTDEERANGHLESVPASGEGENNPAAEGEQETTQGEAELTLEASYFNEIQEVNGEKEIRNPENVLALVNKVFALPSVYEPGDLVRPSVAFSFGNQEIEKSYMRKEAAQALEQMFLAAKKENIQLLAASGYRSYSRQVAVLDAEISKVGKEQAVQAVAPPGKSEHQTGLAMDITSESVKFGLTESFGETPEGQWLRDNAHKFGFILRYPKGKESITGYQYEPWHFRYVGTEAAKTIFENNWTLEEYFSKVKKL
ncbi:MAG TPA: M15 family metallopeptidase [Bacillaceae bacterium]